MKPDTTHVPLLTSRGYRPVARLRPRTACEIGRSPWSIGCETLDRDYVDFAQTGPHLGELGATQVRLQAGWAKCDRGDGAYDWAWLDAIVGSAVEQCVRPWLQTSYGNPAYPGGGGIGLAQGIPTSPAALAAWDGWVRALVERYGDRVCAWEIWNEPDNRGAMTPGEYAEFFIRTASLVRSVQPEARIIGLSLGDKLWFAEGFLAALAEAGRVDLLDEVTFHYYPHNPDDAFDEVQRLAAMVAHHAPHASLRQGETGAPSETIDFLAMGEFEWNERKQAAWNLRRLLAHHSRGFPMSLFQLADMQYTKAGGARFEGRNAKGQLATGPDKRVTYRKPSYFMAQHVFSVFDRGYPLQPLDNLLGADPIRSFAHAWTREGDSCPDLVAWWRADRAPGLGAPEVDSVSLPALPLRDPVLIDFMSGVVLAPPDRNEPPWRHLPRLDAPLAMAERAPLHLQPLEGRHALSGGSGTALRRRPPKP